jgi:hypothetical protein
MTIMILITMAMVVYPYSYVDMLLCSEWMTMAVYHLVSDIGTFHRRTVFKRTITSFSSLSENEAWGRMWMSSVLFPTRGRNGKIDHDHRPRRRHVIATCWCCMLHACTLVGVDAMDGCKKKVRQGFRWIKMNSNSTHIQKWDIFMQKETESLLLPFELTKNLSWAILITRKAQI